jgi:hypothetical protein
MSGQEQGKPEIPALLSPGQIAEMKEAAAAGRKAAGNTMEHVGLERSGQLSPPHTPGHTAPRR